MTLPESEFLTSSLRAHPSGAAAARILASALAAVEPIRLISNQVRLEDSILTIQNQRLDLENFQKVILLGIGKAAIPMAQAIMEMLGQRITAGLLLTKPGSGELSAPLQGRVKLLTGSHPVPDSTSLHAAQQVIKQVSNLSDKDLVITLLSGGGSALFILPQPDLTLDDLVITNQLLLECGADIQEINTVRKHLSAVKGGRLAQRIHPARNLTLVLSDVIGDPLDSIASGPTAADHSTYQDALQVVRKYSLALPGRVKVHLEKGSRGEIAETPKPGNPLFQKQNHFLIGSNQDACLAALQQARAEGFHSDLLPDPLQGEARIQGRELSCQLKRLVQSDAPLPRPACLVAGGETTVTLSESSNPGIGGRNLELALAAVRAVSDLANCALITLATDGEDGITDAAGAVVTGESFARARELGLEPEAFLDTHNAYPFFKALDDLVITGPTGTNVNDLCLLMTYK